MTDEKQQQPDDQAKEQVEETYEFALQRGDEDYGSEDLQHLSDI